MTAPARWPAGPLDPFFCLFESPPPMACAWVLAVDGEEPDPARLRAAVERMRREHRRAAARLRRDAGRWVWESVEEDVARACLVEPPLCGPDEARAEAERVERLMSEPLDPEVGPLVRVYWIGPGAYPGRLVIRLHHCVTDGAGSRALLRSLLDAYNGLPPAPAPDETTVAGDRPPVVSEGARGKARLFARLVGLHARYAARHRLAPLQKLYHPGARPAGGLRIAGRRVAAERRQRLIASVRAASVGMPDLLIAATALAAERALAADGRRCGVLRVLVSQNLRRGEKEPGLENRSSAFPVWIGPRDRADGAELVHIVHRQVWECLRTRAAEAAALFTAALRLPATLARWILLPRATRPRVADSLIVSWLGDLPSSEPDAGWFHLGRSRFSAARAVVRPAEGAGAILLGVVLNGHLELTLTTLDGLFDRAEAERYLVLVDAAVDELASALRPG